MNFRTADADPAIVDPAQNILSNLLERKPLADRLGVCTRTVYRWESQHPHPLPVIRIGRTRLYDVSAVSAWIRRHQQHAQQPESRGPGRPKRAA